MKRIPLLLCLAMAGSLSACAGPVGGYTSYQYSGYGPRYDDYYGYGPGARWGYADRRVRPQFTRQMPPGRPPGNGPRGSRGPGRPSDHGGSRHNGGGFGYGRQKGPSGPGGLR